MWARTAAAILCVGAAAGMANININYGESGLTVRTGWMGAVASRQSPVASQQPETVAPWRADLASLERQLRTEFQSAQEASAQALTVARTSEPAMSQTEVLRRVRALVEESERKQERELALRVGEVIRGVNAQRESDFRKINNNLVASQTNTNVEVMKQRQLLQNYANYLSRVSLQK